MHERKISILISCLIFAAVTVSAQNALNTCELKGEIIPGGIIIGNAPLAREILLNGEKIRSDSAGHFIFGFDRDDTIGQTLEIIYRDGKSEIRSLTPAKRVYDIQKINDLDQKYVSPPKEVLEKIEKETKIISEARLLIEKTDTAYYLSGFLRPVEGGRISGVFGGQRILNGEAKNPHNGVDIALPEGTPVYAMADGVVRLSGDNFHYNGNFILLDHGQGLSSVYVHMLKTLVRTGDKVLKGQKIGEVGSTGRSTGPHLHWGVQWYKKRIDPLMLMALD